MAYSQSHSIKAGQKMSLANATKATQGLKLVWPDGSEFRVNILIGQQVEFVAGRTSPKFILGDAFEDLVGIEEISNADSSDK